MATAEQVVEAALQDFFDELNIAIERHDLHDYQVTREIAKIDLLNEWENYA